MLANTGFEVILSGLLSAFTAQFMKFFYFYLKNGRFDFKLFTVTGGLPSSHSAFSVGLTTSVGLILGFYSVDFAIALGFTLIVMYDAAGLRRSAGKMAALLNRMVDDYYTEKKDHRPNHEKIMEVLGHTPFEVLMGAFLGIAISSLVHRCVSLAFALG